MSRLSRVGLTPQCVHQAGLEVREQLRRTLRHVTSEKALHEDAVQRVYLNLLADILESGRQKGLFRESITPRLDAGLLMSALHGILVQGFLGGDVPERSTELLAHLKTSLVDALRRQADS